MLVGRLVLTDHTVGVSTDAREAHHEPAGGCPVAIGPQDVLTEPVREERVRGQALAQ